MSIYLHSIITRNSMYRFQWEETQGCHVLLYPEGLVQLNQTAATVLELCGEETTAAALIETLQERYPQADTLVEDVMSFLHEARDENWIVVRDTE